MHYDFAPMQGLTTWQFRGLHHRHFPGADRYFLPFFSPTQEHLFTQRDWRNLAPEYNEGVPAVPQLMARKPADFLWAAGELAAMGYREVNLNLGCPAGTVAAKGKGAGFLAYPGELDAFLDTVFAACPLAISVKTRLGIREAEEFGNILEIYNRYPLTELILHPRVQKDFYRNHPRLDAFARALEECRCPLCYNGDLLTVSDFRTLEARFPGVSGIMAGRGAAADPALFRKLRGGPAAGEEDLRAFLEALYESYRRDYRSERNAVQRMKELWVYLLHLFEGGESLEKKIWKVTDYPAYAALTERVFRELPLRTDAVGPL